ncbi:putative polysaccharide biosynthesis protein [Streptococcus constellatus subsp. pharyngis]|uniref:Membrane protein n=1 Tax=Streptococcus constellatus subsp. pharyngis SK1060 = CCUG 46377 TaxID=1035184 RepID=F9P4R0_STRCV|nr:polysaccharide biosynthesis protein [Streptococcus constellatus]AGU72347.1 putative polysaccharide biosynthesis/transport protein [Streptococcus constellatus subsp. pharyngis C232]AGU74103.1 putative polysaccharide biosynthesis/transport protein [Streptococcus constellatus subsp. pharyngis C818]AGU79471.1 putative polysaccharide biosynthesis/transport protein [Streptococcus constellatus subsp. pharyngis C1050]EGV10504.1 polysaccharide biosynthesis protein [Streptococcus constellatus subsp. p
MDQQTTTQQKQMLLGTAWLTASNFISRFLGAIYIIPWYIWMGKHGAEANGLFTMGYNIYAWFLLISTAGVPVAVAKQVAKYNTMDQKDHSFTLIREFLKFMLLLGAIFAVVMYLLSPFFAHVSGVGKELIPVMQSLSWAVLVFPAMSVIRGFFQGFNNLKPYAISQIAEQVIRVIWMLLTTFFIMKLGSKDYAAAVTQSTFAAFIGMFASMAVLVYFLWKANLLSSILHKPVSSTNINSRALLVDTIREAIPFIITGSAIQLFQIIDQVTFINVMKWFTNYTNSQLVVMFSYFSANPNKITMILIAVATSIGGVGIPLLTENYVKGDLKSAARLVQDNLSMLLLFLLPATIGSVLVARPLYTIFYGRPDSLALGLFIFAMLQTIILGIYTVLSPMIQALFQNRKAIIYFGYGVLVKLILQIPFIYLFRAYGPLLATTVGLIVPIVLMYQHIRQVTGFNQRILVKRSLLIGILTAIMSLLIAIVEVVLGVVFYPNGRISSMLYLIMIGGLGMIIYGAMALRVRLLDRFIGEKAHVLRQKFHIH